METTKIKQDIPDNDEIIPLVIPWSREGGRTVGSGKVATIVME